MKTKELLNIINRLNKNSKTDFYTKYSIGDNVEFAHIWSDKNHYIPYNFFLIKESNKYIGIVLDMYSDLHWVIKPEYRKRGYLTKSLQNYILPFLFEVEERDEIKISIDENAIGKTMYNNSKSVAQKVGFKSKDNKNFILRYDDFNKVSCLNIHYTGLDNNEINEIKKQLNLIAKKIYFLNSKIEMGFGKETGDYMTSLDELARKVYNFKDALDDINKDFINET